MNLYERISLYHAKSRSAFVLFAEFIGFVGTMVAIVGAAILFSFFH